MNNVGEKYLPIGTVVMLNGGTKRVMITGFCSMAAEDEATMYDYSGCMYPEGFLSSDQTALFNHDQISQIYHMGLVDEEEKQFKANLNILVNQMQNGGQADTSVQQVTPIVPEVSVQPSVEQVPPVGPGLPGYVAPTPVAPSQPVQSNGYSFDENGNVIAAPTQQPTLQQTTEQPTTNQFSNIQFDENGTVVSA